MGLPPDVSRQPRPPICVVEFGRCKREPYEMHGICENDRILLVDADFDKLFIIFLTVNTTGERGSSCWISPMSPSPVFCLTRYQL